MEKLIMTTVLNTMSYTHVRVWGGGYLKLLLCATGVLWREQLQDSGDEVSVGEAVGS